MEKTKWKPVQGDNYFSVLMDSSPYVARDIWDSTEVDEDYYKSGNCYKTRAEANKKLKLIKAILKQP